MSVCACVFSAVANPDWIRIWKTTICTSIVYSQYTVTNKEPYIQAVSVLQASGRHPPEKLYIIFVMHVFYLVICRKLWITFCLSLFRILKGRLLLQGNNVFYPM